MSQSGIANVNALFQGAIADGSISAQVAQTINIPDLGAQIQAGLGVTPDQVPASEVTLVTMMPDDSGSIRFVRGNTEAVRDGHNLVLDALKTSKQTNGILVHCRYLNGDVLYPYCPLDQAVRMTPQNYDPDKGTPLYDQIVTLLATVLVKTKEFLDSGAPVRSVTLIITDGSDQHSVAYRSPQSVRPLVQELLIKEQHIVAAMGINDGTTDFRRIFREMGIEDRWILTPNNDPKSIRAAFQLFSQSCALPASQGAASFSKTAMGGGFGAP